MLLSGFTQALDMNTCPRTIMCNNCEVIHMSGDILKADGSFEDEDDYGFIEFFSQRPLLL